MYTEPEIIAAKRAYIKCYIDGVRERFYNGKRMGIQCNPNKCKAPEAKARELERLKYQLKKMLDVGWRPTLSAIITPAKAVSATRAIKEAFNAMSKEQISVHYLRQVESTKDEFIAWLAKKPKILITDLQKAQIKEFLSQFTYSNHAYMNRRRYISALLSRCVDEKTDNPTLKTDTKNCPPKLNKPFTSEQMKMVLSGLKNHHPNLYLCALIMYGCGLRPHIEIRQLTRSNLSEKMEIISLSGRENKGRKIRSVIVPLYVRELLLEREVDKFPHYANIFTGSIDNFQYYYFLTAWKRIKDELIEQEIITEDHTLYSFRHTAAINVYRKTKDPYKVQRFLGHGSLTVTLTYLRNLGMMVNVEADEDLPDL